MTLFKEKKEWGIGLWNKKRPKSTLSNWGSRGGGVTCCLTSKAIMKLILWWKTHPVDFFLGEEGERRAWRGQNGTAWFVTCVFLKKNKRKKIHHIIAEVGQNQAHCSTIYWYSHAYNIILIFITCILTEDEWVYMVYFERKLQFTWYINIICDMCVLCICCKMYRNQAYSTALEEFGTKEEVGGGAIDFVGCWTGWFAGRFAEFDLGSE